MKPVLGLVLIGLVIVILLLNIIPKRKNASRTPASRAAPQGLTLNRTLITPQDEYKSGREPSKGERECRRVLERIFRVRFPTVRPSWLESTETHKNLELDCYAEVPIVISGVTYRVPIGCEYQGKQHYRQVVQFQDEQQYASQNWNDAYKRRLCELHGVHLIEVPYTVKVPQIEEYIKRELTIRNIMP